MTKERYKDIAILALVICLLILATCKRKVIVTGISPIKADVSKQAELKQVVKKEKEIVKVDVIRYRYIKTLRLPCDSLYTEVVSICDTIIIHDSILIASQDAVIKQDSVVEKDMVKLYSDTLKGLRTQVKRLKWQKRGIIALWIAREGVGIASKVSK